MTTFENRIHEIINDREHGSSTLVKMIVAALRGNHGLQPDRQQVAWALQTLRQVDESMVVVHHLLDELEARGEQSLHAALERYERRWRNIDRQLAGHLLRFRQWDDGRVLTHSHSGMLLAVIRRLHERSPSLEVWQTRSEPGGEGRLQHRALQKAGIRCHLVADKQALALAPDMDGALFGVDQYNDQAMVNKRGTGALTDAMLSAGKPVFVIGDTRKRVDRLTWSSDLFECIPLCQGMYLVTEGGIEAIHRRSTDLPDP
ncbi:hypothetical protein [Marinobacter sp.]|uniref:hypothetical protein n=1 Tax=Marinobacter sp. TaxID=50741 RepID=UPI003565E02A